MRVISKKKIVLFYSEQEDARTALEEWYEKAENAEWECFAHVKGTFRTADYVGNGRIVFNIKGNRYRLVALVLFKAKTVYVRFVGTHEDYDKIVDIQNI